MKGSTRRKRRRHTNNSGRQQAKRFKTNVLIKKLAKELDISYGRPKDDDSRN